MQTTEKQYLVKIVTFLMICLPFVFSGCSRTTMNPAGAFCDVQKEVCERSGKCIHWNRNACASPQLNAWLQDTIHKQLDVDTVIHIALMNNPKITALYEELGIAQAHLVQAGLLKNPIFGMSARFEKLTNSVNIIEMGLVQNFLDILLKPLKTKLARNELEKTKLDVTAQVLDMMAEAKIAFYTMRAAEEAFDFTNEILQTREAAYDAAKRLHDAGNITDLALSIERSHYEQIKIAVADAYLEVVASKEQLNQLMGLWGECIEWKLECDDPEVVDIEFDSSCIENDVITHSLDLQMARLKMQITALRYGIDRSEIVFPELMIGPDSERDPGEPWFVGPQFSVGIPLFDTGKAKAAEARAELSKQWNAYLALAIELRSHARLAIYRLQNVFYRHQQYHQQIIPLEKQITDETLKQFNAMQLGVFDLLSVKQKQVETKLKAIVTYRDYWIARTEVELLLSGRMIMKGK